MTKQQLGVCPYMLMGKTRDQVFDTALADAFNATKFQCIGEQCMAYRIIEISTSNGSSEEVGVCGMSWRPNDTAVLPRYHYQHKEK